MADTSEACPHAGGAITFTLADADILGAPHDYYQRLRDDGPVHFDETLNCWLVSRHEDISEVLKDGVTFSQEMGWKTQFAQGYFDELKAILERDGGGYFPEVLLLDPPGHTRIRKLLNQALGARTVEMLRPRIERLIDDWVERIEGSQGVDAVSDFAIPLTIDIMCEQLGFPQAEAADKIQAWARAYIDQVGGMQSHEDMQANAALICDLQNFIIARVREREDGRREDMISDLIHAVLEDDDEASLTFEETVALTRGLLLAGNDTTAIAISNFMLLMATRPDLAEYVTSILDDNRAMNRFVEELLRLMPPVRGLFRVTMKEVELGGVTLPANAHICILFASANDDERVFSCPRDFDAGRENVNRHLAFGGGIHLCAGISLSRMEIKAVIQSVMTRLEKIELAVPVEELTYTPSMTSMALEALPLRFSKRA
ncbi:MAG: cytochrome P450 [Novosphingobium sp.]|nr:cytochrome P450 [Novosphingobium sp.]